MEVFFKDMWEYKTAFLHEFIHLVIIFEHLLCANVYLAMKKI